MLEPTIREIKRHTLGAIHSAESIAERMQMDRLIEGYDPRVIKNKPLKDPKTIAFVITRLVRFHGGQTSILRLGTVLEKLGYEVSYLIYKKQSLEEMKLCAESNLSGYLGECDSFDSRLRATRKGLKTAPDVIVATSWDTVSKVKLFDKSYKMYFVQDYEPYFYKFGEQFLMAKNTYEQGLHMVSLGGWNREMILKDCKVVSPIDVVSFPYEKSEYPEVKHDFASYAKKKTIRIAVYVKYYGKRLPNLIPYMLENTKKKFERQGIELKVLYFGEPKVFRSKAGTNLGHLTKPELAKLYASVDFGMVASMSNISLVPYEMHAAGLPVIEFADGTYTYFFGEDSALLTRVGERDIHR
ncbi:MAG: glycosyltransferase family 1 protein, partial [Lachnospiraceae bacterium]|nr:glycosyltransferase family 1 protein [Lachnospiraceae bacterium]